MCSTPSIERPLWQVSLGCTSSGARSYVLWFSFRPKCIPLPRGFKVHPCNAPCSNDGACGTETTVRTGNEPGVFIFFATLHAKCCNVHVFSNTLGACTMATPAGPRQSQCCSSTSMSRFFIAPPQHDTSWGGLRFATVPADHFWQVNFWQAYTAASIASCKFQEQVTNIVSKAPCRLQAKANNVASRAPGKFKQKL